MKSIGLLIICPSSHAMQPSWWLHGMLGQMMRSPIDFIFPFYISASPSLALWQSYWNSCPLWQLHVQQASWMAESFSMATTTHLSNPVNLNWVFTEASVYPSIYRQNNCFPTSLGWRKKLTKFILQAWSTAVENRRLALKAISRQVPELWWFPGCWRPPSRCCLPSSRRRTRTRSRLPPCDRGPGRSGPRRT